MEIFRRKRLITVRFQDGHTDKILSPFLNTLIETNKIIEFKRKGGWAIIGKDAIRGMDNGVMPKKDRRH